MDQVAGTAVSDQEDLDALIGADVEEEPQPAAPALLELPQVDAYHNTLYEITGAIANAAAFIEQVMNDHQLDEEAKYRLIDQALATIESASDSAEVKVENWIKYIKGLMSEQAAIAAEEKRLAARRKVLESIERRSRADMLSCLKLIKGGKVSLPIASSRIGSSVSAKVTDETLLPTDRKYWKIKREFKLAEAKKVLVERRKIMERVAANLKAGQPANPADLEALDALPKVEGVELVEDEHVVIS